MPNANGSTAAEIMGLDYKTTIKPGLESFAAAVKGSSMAKLEELILLQKQSSELAAKIEGKRNRTSTLQLHIDEVSSLELCLYSLGCNLCYAFVVYYA